MKVNEALRAMQNLGVSLNDYDSEALDVLCCFVHDATTGNKSLPPLPVPDRTMWQYGKKIEHYTGQQMREYAVLAVTAAKIAE